MKWQPWEQIKRLFSPSLKKNWRKCTDITEQNTERADCRKNKTIQKKSRRRKWRRRRREKKDVEKCNHKKALIPDCIKGWWFPLDYTFHKIILSKDA